MDRPTVNVLSPSSPGKLQNALQLMPGRLSVSVHTLSGFWCLPAKVHWITFCIVFVILSTQVKLWYDKVGHQLTVNVLQAVELPLRPDGRPRSAYVKIYFLPDRRYSSIVFRGWFTKESPEDSSWNHVTFSHTQRQEQTEDENSEEDLRAQMEPDVCLHSRPSQGFPQPHAGADCMGPTQVTRGRQHLHGRGTSWSTSFNLFGVPFLKGIQVVFF